jgi:aryl-alcohol dehydrogenase-like predicted oxidoreductase
MGMSDFYGPADDQVSLQVLHRAVDIGVNFLDTADMYGIAGANERLLSQVLRTRREEVVLATKFGNVRGEDGAFLGVDGRPEYVRQACDDSLQRLGVDVIDLYYQHRVDPKVPIEETVGAMGRLVEQGKVRALGLSEAAPATIRRAHAVHPLSAVQSEYSLLYRNPAEEILPTCRELGISFVAYSPLGRGFLTGAIQALDDIPADDRRRQHPRFMAENFDHNRKLVQRIEEMAAEKRVTPAQLVLAWLLARGRDVIPIPGTKRRDRLDENVGALGVRLDARDLDRIDEAMPPGAAAGLRYPEAQMKGVNL